MAYDEDLQKGIHDLEEILYRLDDRAKNLQWVKEHAPENASEKIKQNIANNFPPPRHFPPAAEPPIAAPVAPVEIPVIAPEPAPKAAVPPAKKPAPVIKAPEAKPVPAAPAIKTPEPKPAAAAPVIKPAEPPVKKPEPAVKPPEKAAPPVLAPVAAAKEAAAPPIELKPAGKPAKKPFVPSKKTVILSCLGLAIAGAGYLLVFNSVAHRYAQAGLLVKAARNSEAVSAYSRIITQYPGTPEAADSEFAIGDIKAVQGDNPGAIAHYEQYLLAAPAGDARIAQARFKIAELEYKDDNLPDAEFLYQNAAIQASGYAKQAAERVSQILAVKARVAAAQKLVARAPGKAVEAYSAVLAEHPKLAAAITGLEEARKALAAAKDRREARAGVRVKRAVKAPPVKSVPGTAPVKPADSAAGKAAMYTKEQLDSCNSVWMTETMQGQLDADMIVAKVKYDCDALKDNLAVCKEAREDTKAMQGLTPEARARMEQEIIPDWTVEKQVAQDKRTLKTYQDRRCADLFKVIPN